jgi:hypothetical protein
MMSEKVADGLLVGPHNLADNFLKRNECTTTLIILSSGVLREYKR